MKNICIFCSANDLSEEYIKPAQEFASRMAKAGYGLVWGGSDTGLMKIVADSAQSAGGKLIGVSMELLKDVTRKNADELIIAKDLGERKKIMLEKADAFVILPGGLGTLDEFSEIIELKYLGTHKKPMVIFNLHHFYDGLLTQLAHMDHEGFIRVPFRTIVEVAETPEGLMNYLQSVV